MEPIRTFTVVPALPTRLQCLREIAYNLHWAWDHETIDLFRRLDGGDLWETTAHNPVRLLGIVSQPDLETAAEDDAFIAHMDRVYSRLKEYMATTATTWYEKTYGKDKKPCIAYFSAEYGIADCMPIYSGGMGVLAGDYLKSASDLGIPLVGIGLLYQQGYFRQYLNADGWQQESYPDNDFYTMPVKLVRQDDGTPVTIDVEYSTGPVKAQIWRAQVGRISLFMLDTNIPANPRFEDRDITDQLYTADQEIRIRQEIMLGIGGVKALDVLGINAVVYHMNEGHSAFLALERIRHLMSKFGISFNEARQVVSSTNVFTTHTPVPAGFDVFPIQLIEKYFKDYCSQLRIPFDEFLALGRENPENGYEGFSMAVLALRLSSCTNAVSKLHGKVSRRMWSKIWPGVPEDEVPIRSIANGIHIRSWVSRGMSELLDRYLGPGWAERPSDLNIWERVRQIPADELWQTHERRRERLVAFARQRLIEQLKRRSALSSEIDQASECLSPDAFTIGFARRFASYKRATLILRDPDRLARILCDKEHPVQIIYAGKAHPQDMAGKELLRDLIHTIAQREELRRRIIFIEEYDTCVARYLVQGVDLWLNTPRRLQEASGTSGMKAAVNGVINMSILDGWWYEAYMPDIGWAIGQDEDYKDEAYQDNVESNAVYQMLEKEVIPLFYDRGTDGLPRKWINLMKASMAEICPVFNTNRMVRDYVEQFYHSCAKHWWDLSADNLAKAKKLASWKTFIKQHWSSIRIDNVEMDEAPEIKVGAQVTVKSYIYLGSLSPEDVAVEIYQGSIDPQGKIFNAEPIRMDCLSSNGNGTYTFRGIIPCRSSGLHGYSIRILPNHEELSNPFDLGLILWAP